MRNAAAAPPRAPGRREGRARRPGRGSAADPALRPAAGAGRRWWARRRRGRRAGAAPRPRRGDGDRRRRARPPGAGSARGPRTAGRAPPSHGRARPLDGRGLVEADQPMPLPLGAHRQIPDRLDAGLPPPRVGPAEPRLGRLPRQGQAVQGGAQRLAAAGPAGRLAPPADPAPQGPARRRAGRHRLPAAPRRCAGRRGRPHRGRPRGRGQGGGGRRCAAGPAPRGGAAGGVEMQPLPHGLRLTARARRHPRGAALPGDLMERQEALAGAPMRTAGRQPAQVLWRLAPPGMVNVPHGKGG